MSTAVLYMSMSLDGFIAGPNETPTTASATAATACTSRSSRMPPTPRGVPVRLPGADGEVFDEMMGTGAIVAGRGTAEPADYWGGDHHKGVPIFILSRNPTEAEQAKGPWSPTSATSRPRWPAPRRPPPPRTSAIASAGAPSELFDPS